MFVRYKPFLVAFFLCVSLFGGLLWLSLWLVQQEPAQTVAETVDSVPISTYTPARADNVSVALMGCSEREGLPQVYFFLKFDVVQGKLFVVEVPGNTRATVNTSTKTVDDFYRYGGMAFAASAIGNLFLQDRCYYLRADGRALTQGIDALEGIPYVLDSAVQTERYTLPAGEQQLDGSRVSDLLLGTRFHEKADLLSAIFALRLGGEQVYRLDTLYQALFACDTDLTQDLLNQLNPAICYALRLPLLVVAFPLLGKTEEGELQPDRPALQGIYRELDV